MIIGPTPRLPVRMDTNGQGNARPVSECRIIAERGLLAAGTPLYFQATNEANAKVDRMPAAGSHRTARGRVIWVGARDRDQVRLAPIQGWELETLVRHLRHRLHARTHPGSLAQPVPRLRAVGPRDQSTIASMQPWSEPGLAPPPWARTLLV